MMLVDAWKESNSVACKVIQVSWEKEEGLHTKGPGNYHVADHIAPKTTRKSISKLRLHLPPTLASHKLV